MPRLRVDGQVARELNRVLVSEQKTVAEARAYRRGRRDGSRPEGRPYGRSLRRQLG